MAIRINPDIYLGNTNVKLGSLNSGSPLVASSVAGMTDTSKVYVNTTDGHWYAYNGTAWADGGVYQAAEDSQTVNELVERVDDIEENQAVIEGKTYKAFITKNAEGDIATFDDGADGVPVKELIVNIEPIQEGEGEPSPSNIRPISCVSSVSVTHTGKNLAKMYLGNAHSQGISYSLNADGSLKCEGTVAGNGNSSFSGGNYYSYESCPWKFPAGTYTVTVRGLSDNDIYVSAISIMVIKKGERSSRTIISNMLNETRKFTIDKPFGAWFWLYVRDRNTVNQNVYLQIECNAKATDYEPCQYHSVTVPLIDSNSDPMTVYGGILDTTKGILTVTHKNIASYNGEELPGRWISSMDVYSQGATPTTGAQVVYELTIPETYQLTPQEITTLLGENNIYADTGDVNVTYRVDPNIAYEKLQNQILSLGGNV